MQLRHLIRNFHRCLFWVLLLFGCLATIPLHAQTRLTGQVIDAETGKPLVGANIFLSGTTFGAASDSTGKFLITRAPFGTYELVASFVGYDAQRIAVSLRDSAERHFNLRLKPRPIQVGEVVVTEADPKEWRENLKVFQRAFFGVKPISKKCRILNPELLDFRYDRDKGEFEASARGPLRIVNDHLGYEMTFSLEAFQAQLYNGHIYFVEPLPMGARFLRGRLDLRGSVHFKQITADSPEQAEEWQSNRLAIYRGSLRHFLTALCSDRLEQDGFKMYLVKNVGQKEGMQADVNSILLPGSSPTERVLTFTGLLKVIYEKARDGVRYEIELEMLRQSQASENLDHALQRIESNCSTQQSWLSIPSGRPVKISTDGFVASSDARLTTDGYWGWDSPSEWLPQDYKPRQLED